MDDPLYVGGMAVIVFLIAIPFIRRWARRKGAEVGERAGRRVAEHDLAKGEDAKQRLVRTLGATTLVAAPEAQAREVLAAATAKGRDDRMLPDGTVEIAGAGERAAIAALAAHAGGTLVHVTTFRETFGGQPLVAPMWEVLQQRIDTAAAAAGVTTTPGPQHELVRHAPATGANGEWTLWA